MLRVAIVTQGDPGRISGGFLYQRRVAELAADEGASVRFVSVPSRRYPLAVVDAPFVLRRAMRETDVLVVDSLASQTLGPLLLASRRWLPPIVGSVHQSLGGSDVAPWRRTVQAGADRLAWRACRALVVPSELLASDLAAAGVRTRMHIVPPGRDLDLDIDRDDAATELRGGRRTAVLCVANWHARKGITAVLDAVARLPADAVTLHLAGDEDVDAGYRRTVLERIELPELRSRVVRHGTVAPERIAGLYLGADVFVLPSTAEPYGIVYGEAMTAGLPVVGWDAGNLPALVDDGVEGRVLPVGDVAALSDALLELAEDDALRHELGAAARDRAARLPTWDDTARGFFEVCRIVAS